MSVQVLTPGLLTTVQDAGRHGSRHLGVGAAGALDAYSFAIANRLVGNPVDAPVLEITLTGPRLRFDRAARIALCGARIDARIGQLAIPGWRPADLPAGCELTIGPCRQGARAYLAVAGGFAVPCLLGSASTDLRGGFGGVRGRMLLAGDILPVARNDNLQVDNIRIAPWWIDPAPDIDFDAPALIRVLPGQDATAPEDALFARRWRVAAASNRQGLRLEGEALSLDNASHNNDIEQDRQANAGQRISEPVAPGTIQLPPDGQPIVLLADAQTHGGYPRLGHVIACDRPRLAQLRPGDSLRFAPCTREQARRLRCEQTQRLARITMAIDARLGQW